eukprot:Opistho-1_new@41296
MKKLFLIGLLFLASNYSFAQSSAKESYTDFTVYRTTAGNAELIAKMLALYEMKDQLSVKQTANVAYHLGRMYEDVGEPENAIKYYEISLKGEPNYEVIHRALGFIYLEKSKVFVAKMNVAKQTNNAETNAKAFNDYKLMVQKALPHLEKYQACDPDDETLAIITDLYKSIKDAQGLAGLPNRLKQLSATCVSLLDDE